MTQLDRLAVWKVVDDLMTRVYRASGQVADSAFRELLREAVLSLDPLMPVGVLLHRLAVIGALLEAAGSINALSSEQSQALRTAVRDGALALSRLVPAGAAAASEG